MHCSLFVVRCSFVDACGLSFVVCHLMFVVGCVLFDYFVFGVCCLLLVVCCLWLLFLLGVA